MPTRETPYSAYNFLVELGDDPPSNTALGGFSDVSGLSTEITMMEYRQGNDKENCVRKIPGMHKSGDVTLKRGLMGLRNFWTWVEATRTNPDTGRAVTITLNDEVGTPILRWKLLDAKPMKWTGPTLAAKGASDVAFEELVLSVKKLDFVEE